MSHLIRCLLTATSIPVLLLSGANAADQKPLPPIKIALVGDSTVTSSAGWGDGFTARLSDRVEVTNLSAGGRSSMSFVNEGRWKKCLELKPDYVLIQFGHNDQKVEDPKRGTDPKTTYRQYMTKYVDEARAAGIKPILVTSLSRRAWGYDGKIHSTLGPYVEVVLAIAKEKDVPLIDLHARSIDLYEKLGRTEVDTLSPRNAATDPASKGKTEIDHTHLNAKGSRVVGSLLAEDMVKAVPKLAPYLKAASAPLDNPAPKARVPLATIDVWPEGKMPPRGAKDPEADLPARGDNVRRVTNISRPTLAVFPAPKKERTDAPAPAMIICPGGGYSYLCYDKEGTDIAAWLNSAGISAVVLKYRAPNNRAGALQDLQRALSLVRAHSAEWNIDPKRLGVIGFSAGGNLAAKASNLFDQRSYPAVDTVDEHSCRPDFAVLVYPAYLEKDGKVSPDLNLKAKIPPTLIVHSEDDKTHVVGSKTYHAALDEAKVPHEFKLYPTGGHGYGLRCERDAKVWPQDCLEWLRKAGFR